MALLALLFAPLLSAVQLCYASPGVTVNLSQNSGPIGITVTVSGQLENPGAEFKVFWQYIRDWDGRYGFLASGYAEGYNYAANITIPPAARGDHYVIVEDEKNHATGYAVFTVTPKIAVQPDTAPSGAVVAVSGYLINNETIDIKFYDPTAGSEVPVAQALTDAVTGYFSCDFEVPLKPEGDYLVRAYWSGVLQAEAPFHVGYQGMSVTPDRAPSGAVVTVSGGLAINETLIIAFQNSTWSVDVATVQTDQSGQFSVNVTVPEASPGNYSVAALNPVGRSQIASVPFEILPPAQITAASDAVNPNEALPGFSTITVQGRNFIANETVVIYFESAPVQVAQTTTDSTGSFTASFTVPVGTSPGTHIISAVQDPYNVSTSANITVHSVQIMPYIMVWPQMPEPYVMAYVPGDTICFSVNSTTPFNASTSISIKIWDPKDVPFSSLNIAASSLVEVNGFWVAPYSVATVSPVVPKGAAVGIWTWNATYYLNLYPDVQFNASGVFLVIPEPDLNYILQRLNEIDAKIDGLVYKQDQLYLLIESNHNYVMARLDQLEGNLASITLDGFANINTVLGQISVKLDVIDAKITNVEGNVAIIQTSLGTMTADISTMKDTLAIMNAEIAEIRDGVAVLKTDAGEIKASLSALNATVSSIKDGVASVQTSLGELKADLNTLNATITAIQGDVAAVETAVGEVKVALADLRSLFENASASITGLVVDTGEKIVATIEAGNTVINARLDAINATVVSVQDGVATISTDLGELKASLAALGANVTQLILDSEKRIIVQMETLLGPVNATLEDLGGKITAIHGNVADVLIPGLGEVKALVRDARDASERAAQTASRMNTLMYAVVALSLVAAALSAAVFFYLRRKSATS